ncbi:MAG: NAD-dependent epimerase/dehydratase family protein [Candidatus Geothermincolia bacterium]
MSVLVTGVDTLLGYHISRALASAGFVVRALIPSELDGGRNDGGGIESCPGTTADSESCVAALEGVSSVFHCESGHLANAGPIAGRLFVEGTRNLLVAMARTGVEDLVYMGSALMFQPGDLDDPGDESSAWDNPLGLPCLDVLRAAGELLSRYNDSGKIKCLTMSPTLVLGDHDMPGGAGWWIIDQVRRGALANPSGSVNVVRARDAARAAVKALGRAQSGRACILGGHNIENGALASEILSAAGLGEGEGGSATRGGGFLRRVRRLVPRVRAPEPEISKLARLHLCYTPALAVRQLGLELTPVADTIREAALWYVSRSS